MSSKKKPVLPKHTSCDLLGRRMSEPRSARCFEVKIINDAARSAKPVAQNQRFKRQTTVSEKWWFLVNWLVCWNQNKHLRLVWVMFFCGRYSISHPFWYRKTSKWESCSQRLQCVSDVWYPFLKADGFTWEFDYSWLYNSILQHSIWGGLLPWKKNDNGKDG